MNLENVTVALRPRGNWESTDLGARMVRRDAGLIYKLWFALTLPQVFVVLLVSWFTPYAGLALLVYWWLEPITDGAILHVLSQRLFGAQPTLRQALRATLPAARRNWIFLLTPMRLHFARSTAIPLTQLEGLRGAARRNRAKVLNRRIHNHGVGVTLAYQHLALCIYFGLILLSIWLLPESKADTLGESWWQLLDTSSDRLLDVLSFALVYAAQSALHPWFVGAGFGLYINCRSRLEAWDIEVAFRRAVARRKSRAAALAAAVLLAFGLGAMPQTLLAQAENSKASQTPDLDAATIESHWSEEATRDAARDAARSGAYRGSEVRYRIQRRNRDTQSGDEAEPSEAEPDAGFWEALTRVIALLTEAALWIVVGLFVLVLFVTRKRWMPALGAMTDKNQRPRKTRIIVSGEVVDSDELPEDVAAEARRLWGAADHRAALSLLFRSSVINAVERFDLSLPDSATEGICVRAVKRVADSNYGDDFKNITDHWLRCAYAGRVPDANVFEKLLGSATLKTVAAA